jgi:hypothetical protein
MAMREPSLFSRGDHVSLYDVFARRWKAGHVLRQHGEHVHIATRGRVHCITRAYVRAIWIVSAAPVEARS